MEKYQNKLNSNDIKLSYNEKKGFYLCFGPNILQIYPTLEKLSAGLDEQILNPTLVLITK